MLNDLTKRIQNKQVLIDRIYKISFGFLSFLIPFLICIFLFKNNGFYPFNEDGLSILSFDLQSQYISYLRYYKQCLLNGNSLIYTLTKLFGGDFMSIFSYYISSPFNLFIVFVGDFTKIK